MKKWSVSLLSACAGAVLVGLGSSTESVIYSWLRALGTVGIFFAEATYYFPITPHLFLVEIGTFQAGLLAGSVLASVQPLGGFFLR